MLLALPAVFMPVEWMAAIHRWLGLGELPATPLVEYLARSTSALYVLLGSLFFVIAGDLRRYAAIVKLLTRFEASLTRTSAPTPGRIS